MKPFIHSNCRHVTYSARGIMNNFFTFVAITILHELTNEADTELLIKMGIFA